MTIIYITLYIISVAVLLAYWICELGRLTLLDVIEALALSLVLTGILYFIILAAEKLRDWWRHNKFRDPILWQRKEARK